MAYRSNDNNSNNNNNNNISSKKVNQDSKMTSASLLRSNFLGVSSRHSNTFKTLLAFSMNTRQSFNCLSYQNLRTLSSISPQHIVFKRCLNSGYQQRDLSTMNEDSGSTISAPVTLKEKIYSLFQRIGWIFTRSSILHCRARQIYGCCTDGVDYKEFFKVCNMPDTFQSWFLVIHLHIWMCYVRLNSLDDDGKTVNQKMAELMWEDIRERINLLGIEDTKAKKESFKELAEQFYGLTIVYNKAFMSENEKDFADAIWRNLFHDKEKTSRKSLEIILQYIDKQLTMLDGMKKEELLGVGKVEWTSLEDILNSKSVNYV
ncbi:ubiquinol-cytochrome-c reductase complex assembly factor 1-like [Rhopilema esculentum]|uniref:ubiquinol-cytochrome-c reductase complex assembly factor 1-like n=1 Tax=Rhopilema esculentum TaxID=499914 RepID=UPI0031DAD2DD